MKVWGLVNTQPEGGGTDGSPERKAGLWDAEVGGHAEQGTSTGGQSPKGGTLRGILHKSKKGSVCAGGLKESVRETVWEGLWNWIIRTLKAGLSPDFTL